MSKRMTIEERAVNARQKAQEYEERAAEVRARDGVEVYRKIEGIMKQSLWLSDMDGIDEETQATATRLAARLDVYLARLRAPFRPHVNQNAPVVQTTITGDKERVS